MKTFRCNIFLMLLVFGSLSVSAQTKKLDKSYKTSANVTLDVDASHTNIIIEKWDKNEVQIEAFMEGGENGKDANKQLLESWKLQTSGNSGRVSIVSGGGGGMPVPPMDMSSFNGAMANLPEIIDPVMEMVGPLLESMSRNPLPPEVFEGMGDLQFDYSAYQKEGDKYMEKWEKKIEKKFGKDFEVSMEQWASNIEKDTVLWKKDIEIKMEKWGENFGASMEAWGEKFGKEMEKWAEQVEKEVEARYGDSGQNKIFVLPENSKKAKRTIRLKVPNDAKLELKVRHGEVNLAGRNSNVKADFSHSQFSANTISGKQTHIRAAYTPVNVKMWEYGELETTYVQNCDIASARSLKITSNSSDVKIGQILETGIISGTFGQLKISKLADGFNTLDITLENSDLELKLPNEAFNFNYNGSQSEIEYPVSIKGTPIKNYDTQIINGYHKSKSGNGTISIKAKYSDVVVK